MTGAHQGLPERQEESLGRGLNVVVSREMGSQPITVLPGGEPSQPIRFASSSPRLRGCGCGEEDTGRTILLRTVGRHECCFLRG